MVRQKKRNIILIAQLFTLFSFSCFAFGQEAPSIYDSKKDVGQDVRQDVKAKFIKASMAEKKALVELTEASSTDDMSLLLDSIEWCTGTRSWIGEDEELIDLTVASVKRLNPITEENSTETVNNAVISEKIRNTFDSFNSQDVKISVLEKIVEFPCSENTAFVNDVFVKAVGSEGKFDEVLLADIIAMEALGNMESFELIFTAYLNNLWEDYSMILQVACNFISQRYEDEVIQMLKDYQDAQQLAVVEILSKNLTMSEKIRREVAETVLSRTILNIGEMTELSELTSSDINLQLMAFDTLTTVEWQENLVTVQDFFKVTKSEYDVGLIDDSSFAGVITKVAGVADPETAAELSAYLDFLNRNKEQSNEPVEAVVLSVINALGELGDKSAFDSLLCVIYLDYSDEVVEAAKVALANLKW